MGSMGHLGRDFGCRHLVAGTAALWFVDMKNHAGHTSRIVVEADAGCIGRREAVGHIVAVVVGCSRIVVGIGVAGCIGRTLRHDDGGLAGHVGSRLRCDVSSAQEKDDAISRRRAHENIGLKLTMCWGTIAAILLTIRRLLLTVVVLSALLRRIAVA